MTCKKPCEKKRAKSCHAKTMQKPCQNHVKIMSCKHAKTMQTCKNHAKTMQKTMQKPCNMRRVRWRLHCEKTCKLFVSCKKQAVPHAMKKPRAKPCEKTCKLFVSCKKQAVPHVMQKPCKNHAKTMQTCKNHATCGRACPALKPCRACLRRRQRTRSMPGKWRAILLQYCGNKSQPWSNFESNRGGKMQGILHSPYLSVEGVFQMAYIPPERLLALVRPAFDLVLRRIRSLKRCVQA